MPIPIILPKFGFTLETADVVRWLKQDGDTVRGGDPICEVTTDKVNMEVEAPEDGTLIGLMYAEGATVPVTDVIAYLLRPGEARPASLPGGSASSVPQAVASSAVTPTETQVAATPIAQRVAEAAGIDLTQVLGTGPNKRIMRRDVESRLVQPLTGKVRATPAARHLAEQANLDLHAIQGNGPRGRIQSADVQAALDMVTSRASQQVQPAIPPPMPVAPAQVSAPAGSSAITAKIVKLEGMRRTIAARLQKSFQTAPHIFFDAQIDMTAIEALRQKLKARDEKLSVTAILVKACAWTLLQHPWLNATLEGEEISLWPVANIGVAVALDAGLIVPVVRQAEKLSMRNIQTAVEDLTVRARSNSLHFNDVLDGTFTISNLGMYGVDRFTAIINPPQVAILAVGRTVRQFVPDENEQPILRSFMTVTLSADHRVVDGVQVANFLQDLRGVLEQPGLMAW